VALALFLLGGQNFGASEPTKAPEGGESEFYCPLHPRIVRCEAGEKCPLCRMPLTKRKRGTGEDLIQSARDKLAQDDRRVVADQDVCPICEVNRLGLEGEAPIKLMLKGRTVFVCYDRCEKAALSDPDGTLANIERLKEKLKPKAPVK
jgi:hypothetical protein